jgi:methylmalonyl-CoA/ethylmalonyl-CoA epimerase
MTEQIHDPLQKVNVQCLKIASDSVQVELVEPVGSDSPVRRFLSLGGGMNHLCYEVADVSASLKDLRARKSVILSSAKPAIAFGGRKIAWVITREKLLIELLEMKESR